MESVKHSSMPECRAKPCDNALRCIKAGRCCYKSSAEEANERRVNGMVAHAINTLGTQAVSVLDTEKGKQDFTGKIDGAGYKQSFDNPAKPPVDLVWPGFTLGIGRVLGHGAQKYARGNWMRGMSWCGVLAAILRHTFAILMGEDVDPDSGELHVYHIACEAMFLAHFQDGPRKAEYAEFDDRLFGKVAP